jgi:hypothetical protein
MACAESELQWGERERAAGDDDDDGDVVTRRLLWPAAGTRLVGLVGRLSSALSLSMDTPAMQRAANQDHDDQRQHQRQRQRQRQQGRGPPGTGIEGASRSRAEKLLRACGAK